MGGGGRRAARARRAARRRARRLTCGPACERRQVAEDRSEVAVAEQHHREHDPGHREPGGPGEPPRLQRLAEREDRRHEQRPADRVVQEGRAGEEPRVLLVDQECGRADERASRRARASTSGSSACRARARAGSRRRASRPRPRRRGRACAGSSSCRRPRRARAGRRARMRATATGTRRQRRIAKTSVPTIASASRISPSSRNPAAKGQWTSSALGVTVAAARSSRRPGAITSAKSRPDADHEQRRLHEVVVEALAGVVEEAIRYGCRIAQTIPPRIVTGPIDSTAKARAELRSICSRSVPRSSGPSDIRAHAASPGRGCPERSV